MTGSVVVFIVCVVDLFDVTFFYRVDREGRTCVLLLILVLLRRTAVDDVVYRPPPPGPVFTARYLRR